MLLAMPETSMGLNAAERPTSHATIPLADSPSASFPPWTFMAMIGPTNEDNAMVMYPTTMSACFSGKKVCFSASTTPRWNPASSPLRNSPTCMDARSAPVVAVTIERVTKGVLIHGVDSWTCADASCLGWPAKVIIHILVM